MCSSNSLFSELLTNGLCQYIDHLQEMYGYRISLHHLEQDFCENWYRFIKYYYHQCPLCTEVKSSSAAWSHCIVRQDKVLAALTDDVLVGTCYAGVTEFVFPLCDIQGHNRGFLCLSGYCRNREESKERAVAVARKYGINKARLLQATDQLITELPDLNTLKAQISPLQAMFTSLCHFNKVDMETSESSSPRQALYQQIIKFANNNYRNPEFSLRMVCETLYVSYSYASRVFSEFNDVSFTRYIRRMRIESAKRYLEYSREPISMIAAKCGFSDSNYFSSQFKLETNMMPKEYRQRHAVAAFTTPETGLFTSRQYNAIQSNIQNEQYSEEK